MKLAKDLTKSEIENYVKRYEQDWNTPEEKKGKETFEKIACMHQSLA